MTLNLLRTVFFSFSLMLAGCEPSGKRPSDLSPQELVKSREIKKVSNIDILESGKKMANEISLNAQEVYMSHLESLEISQDFFGSIKYYDTRIKKSFDSLSNIYNVQIDRIGKKKEIKVSSEEQEILEAYAYNVENSIPLLESVHLMERKDSVLYTKPISLNMQLCLRCHGMVDDEISQNDYQIIKKRYPNDSMVNHKLNSFYGMWSIKISKKQIITSMD